MQGHASLPACLERPQLPRQPGRRAHATHCAQQRKILHDAFEAWTSSMRSMRINCLGATYNGRHNGAGMVV